MTDNNQAGAEEANRSSKDAGIHKTFSFLMLLSDKNLRRFNMQEDEVVNQVMNAVKSHKFFVKWTDTYLVNESKLANPMNEDSSTSSTTNIKYCPSTNVEEIKYTFASCMKEENVSDVDAAKRVFEKLISSDQDPRVNLIILTSGSSGMNIANKLFAMIDKSLNSKSYCLWGGETRGMKNADYIEEGKIDYQSPIFMGIRMLNSSMKSWSLIVHYRELEEKLAEFKKRVQLKRRSFGFVCGRSILINQQMILADGSMNVGKSRTIESSEYMELITATFPNTVFFGGFNNGLDFIYGFNSLGGDDCIAREKLAVSLMIITHD